MRSWYSVDLHIKFKVGMLSFWHVMYSAIVSQTRCTPVQQLQNTTLCVRERGGPTQQALTIGRRDLPSMVHDAPVRLGVPFMVALLPRHLQSFLLENRNQRPKGRAKVLADACKVGVCALLL
jgi:hypothetical protein